MKFVMIIAIAFVLLIPIPVFADPHTIETANDSGLNLECAADCYTPSTLTVDVGHIVTMTNTDETGVHTFTSGTVYGFTAISDGKFDSGMLNLGESFDYNANTVGKFPFYCSLHVWMQGLIIVEGSEEYGTGAQDISMWMIPVILAGVVVGVFVIKRRK